MGFSGSKKLAAVPSGGGVAAPSAKVGSAPAASPAAAAAPPPAGKCFFLISSLRLTLQNKTNVYKMMVFRDFFFAICHTTRNVYKFWAPDVFKMATLLVDSGDWLFDLNLALKLNSPQIQN